ncbi:MAG: bifunctional methylenetetrahydrofolate dehydrogenase/methenyltetrahydrofolate cyclohydrolase FolD [Gammaproteobacteria bacterium]|nr:bifunctional methylenetetrahydrofolate dehydrogenase/methenyltetrahydrofolate cyclohydrolase FolD [Gammaproteobacteria bacterium]
MTATLIDGKATASRVRDRIRQRVEARLQQGLRPPGLAVILVGEDPASQVYVRNKRNACEIAGFHSESFNLPTATDQTSLEQLIKQLNLNPAIDGILLQLPLPAHLDEQRLLDLIDPAKDVDGFHPCNMGLLALRLPGLRACTPKGVMALLADYGIEPVGQDAVIVGASNIVGRPMALELLLAGATVTVCHRFTRDLQAKVAQADILVVAVGKPGLIPGQWVKPGAVVIDVGINRQTDGTLVGDIDFANAVERAGWITPVPGGVGPMTIAMLLQNTLEAAEASESAKA